MSTFEVCHEIDECLQRLESDDGLAVAVSRFHMKTSPFQQNTFCFHPSQNVYNYLTTIMIRYNFTFKYQMNDVLNGMLKAGLFAKYQHDFGFRQNPHVQKEEVRQITMKDFYFGLVFCAIFISISFTLLLVERFISYKVKTTRYKRFWRNLEKSICGKRCFMLLKLNNEFARN